MEDGKIIIFEYRYGHGEHNSLQDEVTFNINATDDENNEVYADWILETVGERCTWYEKD